MHWYLDANSSYINLSAGFMYVTQKLQYVTNTYNFHLVVVKEKSWHETISAAQN